MLIKHIIIPSFTTIWKKKWLWFLSLLTITPFTIGNEWVLATNTYVAISNPKNYYFTLHESILAASQETNLTIQNVIGAFIQHPLAAFSFILAVALFVASLIFTLWIIMNGQSIIIYNLSKEKIDFPFSLNRSLSVVTPYWQKVLMLNLSLLVIKTLVIIYLIILGFLIKSVLGALIAFIITAISIIFLMSLSYILRLSIFKILLEMQNMKNAFKEAYGIFKKRYLDCFELSLILFLLTLASLVVFRAILNTILPDEQFNERVINVFLVQQGFFVLFLDFIIFGLLLFLIGILLLWQYSAWLLWYEEQKKENSFSYIKFFIQRIKIRINK